MQIELSKEQFKIILNIWLKGQAKLLKKTF